MLSRQQLNDHRRRFPGYTPPVEKRPSNPPPPLVKEEATSLPGDIEQLLFHRLQSIRRQFGMVRIEMGALLSQIQKRKAWEGRASSFGDFLEAERINRTAASDYMRIADKFFFELRLSETQLFKLADANMNVLVLAAKVITEENKDEILNILETLSERDAKQVLLEMVDETEPLSEKPPRSDRVTKAINIYRNLPDDQRIELLNAIVPRNTKAQKTA